VGDDLQYQVSDGPSSSCCWSSGDRCRMVGDGKGCWLVSQFCEKILVLCKTHPVPI
jgi:hypothetical protein